MSLLDTFFLTYKADTASATKSIDELQNKSSQLLNKTKNDGKKASDELGKHSAQTGKVAIKAVQDATGETLKGIGKAAQESEKHVKRLSASIAKSKKEGERSGFNPGSFANSKAVGAMPGGQFAGALASGGPMALGALAGYEIINSLKDMIGKVMSSAQDSRNMINKETAAGTTHGDMMLMKMQAQNLRVTTDEMQSAAEAVQTKYVSLANQMSAPGFNMALAARHPDFRMAIEMGMVKNGKLVSPQQARHNAFGYLAGMKDNQQATLLAQQYMGLSPVFIQQLRSVGMGFEDLTKDQQAQAKVNDDLYQSGLELAQANARLGSAVDNLTNKFKNDLTPAVTPFVELMTNVANEMATDRTPKTQTVKQSDSLLDIQGKLLSGQPVKIVEDVTGKKPAEAPKSSFKQMMADVDKRLGLPIGSTERQMMVESRGITNAVGPARKDKNGNIVHAQGAFQFMPATAKQYGVKDPYDPVQALRGYEKYMKYLLKLFHGNKAFADAAYNWGEGNVQRWQSGKAVMPPETIDYIKKNGDSLTDLTKIIAQNTENMKNSGNDQLEVSKKLADVLDATPPVSMDQAMALWAGSAGLGAGLKPSNNRVGESVGEYSRNWTNRWLSQVSTSPLAPYEADIKPNIPALSSPSSGNHTTHNIQNNVGGISVDARNTNGDGHQIAQHVSSHVQDHVLSNITNHCTTGVKS